MASSFLPQPSTTLSIAVAAAPSGPFLLKPAHIPTIKNPIRRHKISCKSNDQDPSLPPRNFDCRNILIGVGGLYGATSLATSPFSFADPISAPDITKCGPADLPPGAPPTNCCPLPTAQIIDFKFPPPPTTMRVRPTAHLADQAYIAKFNKAMKIMRSLPENDPRSFKRQAKVHYAYCDGAYDQAGFPNLELQVHDSWLFFPFHRYYLYFFERILGKLIDDPTFAMPFWNYDSPGGMRISAMYANPNSPLYDSLRDKAHQPPTVIDLNFSNSDNSITSDKKPYNNVQANGVKLEKPTAFLRQPLSPRGRPEPREWVHRKHSSWPGSCLDRMWSLWKGLGGRREDIKDHDFLDGAFLFYDENGHLVWVKVRDCLDNTKLGYVYQDVEIPWLESRPKPRISSAVRKMKRLVKANAADTTGDCSPREVLPAKVDKVLKVMVKRPKKKRSKKEKDELEEILIIQGIELDRDVYAKFDVYINDEDDEVSTEENTEFAGSFVNVPHKHKHGKKIKTQLRLSITDLLEDLDAEDDEHVFVTLVPTSAGDSVKIHGIKIELDD
ncbi:hypothetical protein BUALT_Bualt08G0006200 [Buddleja alternifolia]|uniref:Tyrosinase copper-binding domain-containing protein n=1 Tax=Buddleja alternifolia TaxID=168488 RepID=A0AAV6X6T9_9LAMI|nr:hypothetical protein BUALT_Bualt08G0006200 [Buddleja alternifolia]